MKLVVFSSVKHSVHNGRLYGYAPYVREINLWGNYVDEFVVIAFQEQADSINVIDTAYNHKDVVFKKVSQFDVLTFWESLKAVFKIPIIFFKCISEMWSADHIHIRCPGNIGFIACFAQVFFPKKAKSTKYAGNWDPSSDQPWTYKWQQAVLRNVFLTRNMKVLVYGKWPNEPEHITPFFTASYFESDKIMFQPKDYSQTLRFVFLGALVKSKRPLLTIQIIKKLHDKGRKVQLDILGDGPLRIELEDYIKTNELNHFIFLHGNQDSDIVKSQLLKAHFSILPSKSEGWPKALTEGMFLGSIPIATKVSSVPWMLDEGKRGILIAPDLELAVSQIEYALEFDDLQNMAKSAMEWSQTYTLERFESEIEQLIK